jgi:hypothetical protein
MCGKRIVRPAVIERIDGTDFTFDSDACLIIFKRFTSVYGIDFIVASKPEKAR